MLPQTSWIRPAAPPTLEHLAGGGRAKNKTVVFEELTIKKAPLMGALHVQRSLRVMELHFYCWFGFFFSERACLKAVCKWLESDYQIFVFVHWLIFCKVTKSAGCFKQFDLVRLKPCLKYILGSMYKRIYKNYELMKNSAYGC